MDDWALCASLWNGTQSPAKRGARRCPLAELHDLVQTPEASACPKAMPCGGNAIETPDAAVLLLELRFAHFG